MAKVLTSKEEALYQQYLKDMEELKGDLATPPRDRDAWVKLYREQQGRMKGKKAVKKAAKEQVAG